MAVAAALSAALVAGCDSPPDSDGDTGEERDPVEGGLVPLEARIRDLAAAVDAEVGVYYHTLGEGEPVVVNPDLRMHAASTMKVPVLLQLFLDDAAGRLSLDDSVEVSTRFESIVDGTPYELDAGSDSDSTLYGRTGARTTYRELAELMVTRSSNLATNLLIREVGAERVTATLRRLGADSMEVLRGVEDIPAFEAGLSNTTTARDLGILFEALGRGTVASHAGREEMLAILQRQEFREKIPAGLPAGVRVANKTGWITGISHDAALVYPPADPPYVLVVLTRGVMEQERAEALIREISRAVWAHHTSGSG